MTQWLKNSQWRSRHRGYLRPGADRHETRGNRSPSGATPGGWVKCSRAFQIALDTCILVIKSFLLCWKKWLKSLDAQMSVLPISIYKSLVASTRTYSVCQSMLVGAIVSQRTSGNCCFLPKPCLSANYRSWVFITITSKLHPYWTIQLHCVPLTILF